MSDYAIREYCPEDIPALCALWERIFGDPRGLIESFFELLPGMGAELVAEKGGEIAGMAAVLTGMELIEPGKRPRRCGYIYAVAVSESERGQGIGAELVRRAVLRGRELGAEIMCTLPAEDSLYGWYEELMGVTRALSRRRFETEAEPLYPCEALSAREYMRRREELLSAVPHLRLTGSAPDFAERFYKAFGGGLFQCGSALCAAYADGERAYIKELVCPEGTDAREIAASAACALGARGVEYFLPAPDGEAYIAAEPDAVPPDCIWNLSFD